MDVLGKEYTLAVKDKVTGQPCTTVASVRFLITRRKAQEIVRHYRRKVGLAGQGPFDHLNAGESDLLVTDQAAQWIGPDGKPVVEGLLRGGGCPISVRSNGTMHLYNIVCKRLVLSESYPLATLMTDFGESSELVELPDDRLKPGQNQGAFQFIVRA